MKKIYDWNAIQQYHDEGHGFVECHKRFGTHTAWTKAIHRGELRTTASRFRDRRRRYDWAAVQAFYDEGHTYLECRERFGFCPAAWTKAVQRGELKARARMWPIQVVLARARSRHHIKTRLLENGLLENRCLACGLSEWLGKPLSIQIDHINGVKDDHRLENLRMLCPNCHSQTETFSARNKARKALQGGQHPI